jgi:hypothetical protein
MTDTPSTAAGRALSNQRAAHDEGCPIYLGTSDTCDPELCNLDGDILDIEAEARADQRALMDDFLEADSQMHATIESLREALTRLQRNHECEPESEALRRASIAADEHAEAVLSDTAPAAASAKAEIEQAAVERWIVSDEGRDLVERAFRDHILSPVEGWPHRRVLDGPKQYNGCDDLCSDRIVTRIADLLNTPATPEGGE